MYFSYRHQTDLQMTSRIVPTLEEDDRLVPLLRSMNKVYFGQDYSKKSTTGAITAEMIDGVRHHTRKIGILCYTNSHIEVGILVTVLNQ